MPITYTSFGSDIGRARSISHLPQSAALFLSPLYVDRTTGEASEMVVAVTAILVALEVKAPNIRCCGPK